VNADTVVVSLRTTSIVPSELLTMAVPPLLASAVPPTFTVAMPLVTVALIAGSCGTPLNSSDGSFGLLPPQACSVAAIAPSDSA
jgi:hypothetical protein